MGNDNSTQKEHTVLAKRVIAHAEEMPGRKSLVFADKLCSRAFDQLAHETRRPLGICEANTLHDKGTLNLLIRRKGCWIHARLSTREKKTSGPIRPTLHGERDKRMNEHGKEKHRHDVQLHLLEQSL